MNIRVLFILLIVALLLSWHGRFRRIGVILSALLLVAIAWVAMQPTPESASNSSITTTAPTRTPLVYGVENLVLEGFTLSGNGAPWRVTGEVRNQHPTLTAKSAVLGIERLDCASPSTPAADCSLNWRGQMTLDLALKPSKSRRIEQELWNHSAVPRIDNIERLRFTVLRVSAAE